MEAPTVAAPDARRFASLLGDGACPRPDFDEILFETRGCVIAPTLGSILPFWLLIVPRNPVLNFALWQAMQGTEPSDLVEAILAECDIATDRTLWFEHGPASTGSSMGCGVDQAHLHLLVDPPFSFRDFAAKVMEAGDLAWEEGPARTAYQSLEPKVSYLIVASGSRAVMAQNVETVGSQFFRRVIADMVQQPDAWDYRTHPHLENVRRTIRMFRGLMM
jgi:ATP adenylyltransferase